MKSGVLKRIGRSALTTILAVSLSLMMMPTVALADDPDPDDFEFTVIGDGGHVFGKETEDIDTDKGGMLVEANNNGYAEGILDGSISAVDTGVEVVAHNVTTDETNFASAEVTGDVTSTGNQSYGVIVETQEASGGTVAQAEVGNVEAPNGFKVQADGGTATIVAENITSTDDSDERVTSNLIKANGGQDFTFGTANADLGDVTSASDGLNMEIDPLGVAVVNAEKIEADGTGVDIENYEGIVIMDVSEVEAGNMGIYVHSAKPGATSFICVDGDVKAANNIALDLQNYKGGKSMILVANDAASEGTYVRSGGLAFFGSDVNAQAIALVAGVLSGFNGVVLERDGYANPQEILDLTTWKIEANGGELIRNEVVGADTDAFAKSISYIVKIEQPTVGGTVRATKADGSPLDRKFSEKSGLYGDMLDMYKERTGKDAAKDVEFLDEIGFDVAHETDKVLLKVDLDEGYKVAGAYNGMGEKVELLIDDNGDYYVIVERGGGLYLSVDLELESYEITFDLDGGTLDGETGFIVRVCEYGSVIEIPGAPTRDGYDFLYWEGSHYDPGQSYSVKGAHLFTAMWQKKAEPEPEPEPDPKPEPEPEPKPEPKPEPAPKPVVTSSPVAAAVLPQTGDETPGMPVVAVLLVAGVALMACGLKLRKLSDER